MYDVPAPDERRRNLGNQFSGGEQQMLAVGRALILNPRLLLDEPLEGLAPIMVEELLRALRRLMRDEGMAAIWWSRTCRRCWGSPTGRPSWSVALWSTRARARPRADRALLERYLGVTAVGPRRSKAKH